MFLQIYGPLLGRVCSVLCHFKCLLSSKTDQEVSGCGFVVRDTFPTWPLLKLQNVTSGEHQPQLRRDYAFMETSCSLMSPCYCSRSDLFGGIRRGSREGPVGDGSAQTGPGALRVVHGAAAEEILTSTTSSAFSVRPHSVYTDASGKVWG